jgi:hypothetical protein
MKSQSLRNTLILILLICVAVGGYFSFGLMQEPQAAIAQEQSLKLIPLAGPVADKSAEISGLAWFGDTLILLPQYPERFGAGDGVLFAMPKQSILDYLDGKSSEALKPQTVTFVAPGLKEKIANFQGYEAIGFHGDRVFLTIEAGQGTEMHGYLVSGAITADGSQIMLDTAKIVEIPLPIMSENHSDEALLVLDDKILTFYELNGADLVPHPVALTFDLDLNPLSSLSFPHLEYRLTDASLAPDGQMWVINYFFPGDTDMLPKSDPLAQTYGEGPTHAQVDQVERLVAFNLTVSGFTLAKSAPIQLTLEKDSRNWEGLVALDQRGFLVATDKYPTTMLGVVAYP